MLIPEAEIASLKATVSLAALVRSRGITLTPKGKDLMGLCPFHSEKTASFSVTPSTNLFHCFGCDAAGDAFNFLMKLDGIDFPEAVRRLSGAPHNGTHQRTRRISQFQRIRIFCGQYWQRTRKTSRDPKKRRNI